jgi:hypothetical protein
MIYEIFLRLFGAGITGIIHFLPMTVAYDSSALSLSVGTTLTAPLTREARRLAENGMPLRIRYDWSLIVNDIRAYHQSEQNELAFNNGNWRLDGKALDVSFDTLQKFMGQTAMQLPGVRFDAGDRMVVFVKAELLSDSVFTKSTRMETDVLWNCRTPALKESFQFSGERFLRE